MPEFYSWGVAALITASVARICIQNLVIASAAKQSRLPQRIDLWIASLRSQ